MSRIIVPRRDLVLPGRFRQKQGGFIMTPFAHGSGAPPAPAAYWNPADKSPDVDLSDSDKVATNPDVAAFSAVRSVTRHSAGKWCGEFVYLSGPAWGVFCGVATSSYDLTGYYLGQSVHSWGIQMNDAGAAKLYHNASNLGSVANIPAGGYVRIATDIDAGKGWIGNATAWVGGGDPATGTSPSFTFTPGTKLYLASALYFSGSSASMRTRTAAGDMAGTIPSGFSPWG